MNMAGRNLTTWLALAAAAWLCGCNNTNTVDASSGAPREVQPAYELVAQSRPTIADLPLPVGFDLDEGRSRSFSAAGARYVDHVYYGKDDKFALARFYKRQMPVNRWTLVTDMFVQGDIMLDFEKDTERCRVIITETNKVFHPMSVKVQLWTSGRIESPAGPPAKQVATR